MINFANLKDDRILKFRMPIKTMIGNTNVESLVVKKQETLDIFMLQKLYTNHNVNLMKYIYFQQLCYFM